MNRESRALRALLESAFRKSLLALDPSRLVEEALREEPPQQGRVHIVALGKAAPRMARGALLRWRKAVASTLVVAVEGATLDTSDLVGITPPTLLIASHPLPDARSEEAALAALHVAEGLGPEDLLLALISGGSSSLVSLPPKGLLLADKRAVVRELLEAGAPITDVNLVRRHLSRIKGGRLALAAAPARVKTLALSDVVGGSLADIGSGPTVPDPTSARQARDVLARYAPTLLVKGIDAWLSDVPGPTRFPVRTEAALLAGPEDLAKRIANELCAAGFDARSLAPEGGDVLEVAQRRIMQAKALKPSEALVIPCEPTIKLPPKRGRGGRAGYVALFAMRSLPREVALLCGASDGEDGSSRAAGAVVSVDEAEHVETSVLDHALESFDDASAHEALGTAIKTGPTGQNLTDVHVLARAPARS